MKGGGRAGNSRRCAANAKQAEVANLRIQREGMRQQRSATIVASVDLMKNVGMAPAATSPVMPVKETSWQWGAEYNRCRTNPPAKCHHVR